MGDEPSPPPDTEGSGPQPAETPDSTLELQPGNDPETRVEELAVEEYVARDPLLTDASDVVVGTVPFDTAAGDAEVVVVAPADEVDLQSITATLDPDNQAVSVGGETTVESDQPLTSGPGMGAWPSWGSRPQYQVLVKGYLNGNYIGYARFSTKYRHRTQDTGPDLWQIARSAYGQTDAYETSGPDSGSHVQKLYISNHLTSETQPAAFQWDDGITSPRNSGQSCEDLVSVFNIGITDCDQTEVWQSADQPGWMAVNSDQGTVTTGGSRSLEYTSGFRVRADKPVLSTFYQFVTFRVGNDFYPGGKMYGGTTIKCARSFAGTTSAPEAQNCYETN